MRNQVKGFGEININNCNLFLGLHGDTPVIKTLKKISASGAMFNETVLSRMQNIITFKMSGKSTNDDFSSILEKTQVSEIGVRTCLDNWITSLWFLISGQRRL